MKTVKKNDIFQKQGIMEGGISGMTGGIISGILAAFFQNSGYIAAGDFVHGKGSPAALLVHSQILMGAAGMAVFPFLCLAVFPESGNFLLPLAFCAAGSGLGQFFFFRAERSSDPATVSTTMGLRVVLLAVLCALFRHETFSAGQWTGVGLAAAATVLLNFRGLRFSSAGTADLACSLGFYCVSDLSVRDMIRGIQPDSPVLSALFAMCIVNFLTGAALFPLLCKEKRGKREEKKTFRKVLPYASFWTAKQFFLYLCYALIGPVHGNVVLSVRGPLAVGMTWFRERFAKTAAPPVPGKERLRQIASALLMALAIILYTLSGA